jgi:hypothetical protein
VLNGLLRMGRSFIFIVSSDRKNVMQRGDGKNTERINHQGTLYLIAGIFFKSSWDDGRQRRVGEMLKRCEL